MTMNIITNKGTVDTNKEAVIFIFENDDELNGFLKKIAQTKVKTSGFRVMPLVPEGIELNPIQEVLLSVIQNLDGIGGKDTDSIIDSTTDSLNDLICK